MLERIKRSAFTAPILLLIVAVLSVLGQMLIKNLHFRTLEELFLTYIVAELLIFVLPGIVYVKLKKRGYVADMHLVSFGFSKLPLVLLSFLVMVTGAVLINLLFKGQGIGEGLAQTALQLSDGDYLTDARIVVYISITLGVLPAFAEEFIFRGVLLAEYRQYGVIPAVLITSVYFAMIHFDLRLFPYYFLAGLVIGFTAYTTRSAFAAAVLHSLYNLFSLFALPFVLNFLSMEAGIIVLYLVGILFLLSLVLAFSESERLYHNYAQSGLRADAPRRRKENFFPPVLEIFSPSFLVCAVLFTLCMLGVIRLPQ